MMNKAKWVGTSAKQVVAYYLVSQFTLMAQTQKGLRPDFGPAMPPSEAKALYEELVSYAKSQFENVQTGIFGADMKVHLVNDGPVTFNLEIE